MAQFKIPQKTKTEVSPKRHYSTRQLNTKIVLHEIVAAYDSLVIEFNANRTSTNKRRMLEYEQHLKSANKLSEYFQEYIKTNTTLDVLLSDTKIREVIRYELEDGELKKIGDLIRIPNTVPYENIPTTGNTITILAPSSHIDRLMKALQEALAKESARIIVPCNNMIIVIEIGEFTNVYNDDFFQKVGKVVMDYTCDSLTLKPEKPSISTKIVIH